MRLPKILNAVPVIISLVSTFGPANAVDALYQNDGVITTSETPPQVDAKAFVNNGFMNLSVLSVPFETRNTLNFTNRGTLIASPGARFETITHDSVRTPAETFIAPAGSITRVRASQLFSGFNFASFVGNGFGLTIDDLVIPTQYNPFQDYQSATLTISAKTIDIRGQLRTDIGSSIEINGTDVRLINASVYGAPPVGSDTFFVDDGPDGTIDYVQTPIGLTPIYAGSIDVGMNYGALASATKDLVVTPTISGPVVTMVDTASATTPFFRYRDESTQRRGLADDRLPRTGIDLSRQLVHTYYISTNWANPGGTNQTIRAAFIGTTDPEILVDIVYDTPPSAPGFAGQTVLLGTTITNVTDGGVDLVALSLYDTSPYGPVNQIYPLSENANGVWPSNIVVSRYGATAIPISRRDQVTGNVTNILSKARLITLMRRLLGVGPAPSTNAPFRPDLFTTAYVPTNLSPVGLAYTNMGGTNLYVGFSFSFRSTPSEVQLLDIAGQTFLTNNLGRLSIAAKTLDLSRTRIKSQGPVTIFADDLKPTTGTVIEAPYVSINAGNAAGDLRIEGLIRPRYESLSGTVEFFSSNWTNTASFSDPASTNTPPEQLTVEVGFQYTVVNANVSRSQFSRIHDLILRSKKVTIADSGTVESLNAADTEELNIDGNISQSGTRQADFSNIKNLRRLNIGANGSLSTPSYISLGTGGASRLESVTLAGPNAVGGGGVLTSGGVRLDSAAINVGPGATISATSATMDLTSDVITVNESGSPGSGIQGAGPSAISTKQLILNRGNIEITNAPLRLLVTDSFSAPEASGGRLSVPNGLEFPVRPKAADLSGLTLSLDVSPYTDAAVQWPGVDSGAVVAGFSGAGNFAIRSLIVGGGSLSTVSLSGPDAKNALYARQIQFLPGVITFATNRTVVTNFGAVLTNVIITPNYGFIRDVLQIPDNFTIYFGSAVTSDGQDVSDAVDRLIPGRLRLVRLPVTPAGTVEFTAVDGGTFRVPVGVAQSASLDSDGDGVVNLWDKSPFDGVRLSVTPVQEAGEKMVKLSFMAGAGGKYEIEASDALGENWKSVQSVENDSTKSKQVDLLDRTTVGGGVRNYRVRYSY